MRRPKRSSKESTPIEAKQRAIQAQQEKLRKRMLELEQQIQEAPSRMAALEQQRREVLARRTQERTRHLESSRLLDKRYDVGVSAALPGRRRSLKTEQHEARMKFFVLCVVLILCVAWLLSVLPL